jgi:hypothetical protein
VRLGHRLETGEDVGKRFTRIAGDLSGTRRARGIGCGNRYRRYEVPRADYLDGAADWLAANDAQLPTVLEAAVPWSPVLDNIPMYALDKHTRIGLEAIRNLVKYNHEIREVLERYVVPAQRHAAAYMAAFYADAAPLASKLSWNGADQLEALGTEADLLKVGVPRAGIEPLLQLFRANVQHLNKARVHTVCKKRGLVDIATALTADEED